MPFSNNASLNSPWIVSYNAEDLQCHAGSADPLEERALLLTYTDSVRGIDWYVHQ